MMVIFIIVRDTVRGELLDFLLTDFTILSPEFAKQCKRSSNKRWSNESPSLGFQ